MIRRVQFSLNDANSGKLSQLNQVLVEAVRVVNLYIQTLWAAKDFSSKFINFKVDTWLSARLQQALGKQALEIVKSQRKRKKKTMPVFRKTSINLDSRFLDIRFDQNSFDVWFKLHSLGDKIILKLPSRRHKHLLGLLAEGYTLKQSGRLRKSGAKYYLDLYAEKQAPEPKTTGSVVGFDCGYKVLLADSEGQKHGQELEKHYEKIACKQQGSKAFKRALKERDNLINRTVNRLNLTTVKTVVVEALKDVKHGSKGKIRKKFNNKLQRWSYPKVLEKLSRVCDEMGIAFLKVNPAYTSQTCSLCGHVDKSSRRGSQFSCVACGYTTDADLNAAVNIHNRGVYSPPASA